MFSVPSLPGENRGECLGELKSRSVKTLDAFEGFQLLENSHKLCRIFTRLWENMENMFYFFYKIIIFSLYKKKDDIRSAYVYFNFFHETVNSHNLEI